MHRVIQTLSAVLFGLVLLPAGASAQTVEGIAALVNDEPITTVDVRDRMRLIIASTGVQATEESLPRIMDQSLRGLIEETLQLQEAREYEVEVEEAEIEASLADIAARSGTTVENILGDLQRSGVDIRTLRHQLEAEIAWQILVGGRYGSRIRISDQQIEQALERLVASASQPQFRLFEIRADIVGSSQEQEQAAYNRIMGIVQQLQQGAPFPQVAQQFSDAPSSAAGGDMGWVTANQLEPEVAAMVARLQPGQLSNPVRVPGGFVIVALVDMREGTTVLQLHLNQVLVPTSRVTEGTQPALQAALRGADSCDAAPGVAAAVEGAIHSDLGTLDAGALLPQVRDTVAGLEAGQNTGVLDVAAGLQVLFLCDRSIGGPGVPSRDELEQELRGQQISLLARRWLRDLRRDATIEIRQ